MAVRPVPLSKIKIAKAAGRGMINVEMIALTCREVGIPFYAALALFEMESHGRNVYGHDEGGALSGFPFPVTRDNFRVFEWLVEQGQKSNGVGPSQITWKGYFPAMEQQGLDAWDVHDNMLFGLTILWGHYRRFKTWRRAGRAYNGRDSYGIALEKKVAEWREILRG